MNLRKVGYSIRSDNSIKEELVERKEEGQRGWVVLSLQETRIPHS